MVGTREPLTNGLEARQGLRLVKEPGVLVGTDSVSNTTLPRPRRTRTLRRTPSLEPAYMQFILLAILNLGVPFPIDLLLFKAVAEGQRPTTLRLIAPRPKAQVLDGENRHTPTIFWSIAGTLCTTLTSVPRRTRKTVPRANSKFTSTKAHGKEVREAKSLPPTMVVSIRVPPSRRLINQISTHTSSPRTPTTLRCPPRRLKVLQRHPNLRPWRNSVALLFMGSAMQASCAPVKDPTSACRWKAASR